jgi:hypothetical protein
MLVYIDNCTISVISELCIWHYRDRKTALVTVVLTSTLIMPSPAAQPLSLFQSIHLWRHRQFITIFYQFLHIRIEIIHGSHMHILFLPRVGLYVSFLPLANARGDNTIYSLHDIAEILLKVAINTNQLPNQSNRFYMKIKLRNNSWKPYVYIVFTTGRPLCQLFTPR